MNKLILGFVGDLAAGKGTVAKYLTEKHNVNAYRFSTMLRDVLDRMYIPISRENLQIISTLLRQNFSEDVMSKVLAEDVKRDTNDLVIVEGIRRPTDITYLQELDGFKLIYITADPKTRWQRAIKRNENSGDDTKTFETFLMDEQKEADVLIKELGSKAEIIIDNNGDFEDLYKQLDELMLKYTH